NTIGGGTVTLNGSTGIGLSQSGGTITITNLSPSSGGTTTGSGTANYVTKWTSATNLATGTIFDNGNIGVGTASPTNKLSFDGNSAQTIWMERHTTANTAGSSLTLQAGGATTGA